MASKTFLITGATGKQGGAVVRSLLERAVSPKPNILAVTRNPDSGSAKRLASLGSNISLVKGDLDDSSAIFKNVPQKPDSVFLVTTPTFGMFNADTKGEERQGKAFVDAASQAGVKHFVFASVDRGGAERSENDPTNVPHFASKHRIEKHLQQKAQETGMIYSILRTVAFMDNLTNDFGGKIFTTGIFGNMPPERRLNLIDVHDIGYSSADALLSPDKYRNEGFSIAGDYLTRAEAERIFKEVVGQDWPATNWYLARFLVWLNNDFNAMVKWFREEATQVDLEAVRRRNPEATDFQTFLRKRSDFKKA
ncbi:MAG: hypothetical protein Q9227_003902 [Pyrenula ochraceoflavens]